MTPEEQLAYERHLAEIMALRAPKKEKRSTLETWLSSSVVVALIGVLGTGLFGAWVSGLIQDRSKNNEMQRTAQQQRLTEQNAAVIRILGLIANHSSAIDDLLTIVHNSYAEDRFSGSELKTLTTWKQKIRAAHDEADSMWRREKIIAGYTLLYVFDSAANLASAWTTLATAGDAFETCANAWYGQFAAIGTDSRPDEICDAERRQVTRALTGFTAAASAERVRPPVPTTSMARAGK